MWEEVEDEQERGRFESAADGEERQRHISSFFIYIYFYLSEFCYDIMNTWRGSVTRSNEEKNTEIKNE